MSEIDFTARYQLLVALCREHAKIRRASRNRLDSETALKLAVVQEKIDKKLVEWNELEE